MAALHVHTLYHKTTTLSSIFKTQASSSSRFSFPLSSLKTHQENSLFSATNTTQKRPFSLSTRPRRLLCRPPQGKYVREDYLVKKKSAQEIQELLAVEYEKNAMIVKVDTDDEYEFAHDMQVRGLPTLFFISPDPKKDAIRAEGLIPIQMMRDIIDKEM